MHRYPHFSFSTTLAGSYGNPGIILEMFNTFGSLAKMCGLTLESGNLKKPLVSIRECPPKPLKGGAGSTRERLQATPHISTPQICLPLCPSVSSVACCEGHAAASNTISPRDLFWFCSTLELVGVTL